MLQRITYAFVGFFVGMVFHGSLNDAGVPDRPVSDATAKRQAYISCVNDASHLHGEEWNRAVKYCAYRAEQISKKMLDLPF